MTALKFLSQVTEIILTNAVQIAVFSIFLINTNISYQSIQSTMNPLSPDLDQILKDYSHEALLSLMQKISAQQHEKAAGNLNCSANEEYVLKRLINVCLSREAEVKFNAYFALSAFVLRFPRLNSKINSSKLYQYIEEQSKIKDCEGKSSQIEGYVTGKILIFKSLRGIFKDNLELINSLIKLSQKFGEFEQQIIQLASQLAVGKKAQLAFCKFNPNTKSGFILFSLLRNGYKKQEFPLTEAIINDILSQVVPLYPKKSICLAYVGQKLNTSLANPAKYIESLFEGAFGDEFDQLSYRRIYYILELLQSHLASNELNKQNVWNCINGAVIGFWLSQIKVQNTNIKRLATEIKLNLRDDKELAFDVLKQLHRGQVNLSNLNIRHPLYTLYQQVQADPYFQFLLQLCTKDSSSLETEENSCIPIDELQMFVVLFNHQLKAENVAKAIQLFVAKYHSKKEDSDLQALSAIFNSICPHNKKKAKLNRRIAIVLGKINVQAMQLGQHSNEIKDSFKEIKKSTIQAKEEQSPFIVCFLNFQLALGLYYLMFPQEVQLKSDLECAFQELKANFLDKEEGLVPKKKRKLNSDKERNKPVHVLVDIIISLLTKSPQFLRTAITSLFEELIPFLDSADLLHLLQVIQRPDQHYIQDIQNI